MATAPFDGSNTQHAALLDTCPVVAGAIVSKPVFSAAEGRVIIFAMDQGQQISEHRAPFIATVQVLEGRLRFGVGGVERELSTHDWLVMPPNAPHQLVALEPTRFILTLFKKGG